MNGGVARVVRGSFLFFSFWENVKEGRVRE